LRKFKGLEEGMIQVFMHFGQVWDAADNYVNECEYLSFFTPRAWGYESHQSHVPHLPKRVEYQSVATIIPGYKGTLNVN
jgi:hypothetical protein